MNSWWREIFWMIFAEIMVPGLWCSDGFAREDSLVNHMATGGTAGWRIDNIRCPWWRHGCHWVYCCLSICVLVYDKKDVLWCAFRVVFYFARLLSLLMYKFFTCNFCELLFWHAVNEPTSTTTAIYVCKGGVYGVVQFLMLINKSCGIVFVLCFIIG